MYYIINQNDQIVAIDPQLLTQLNIESADEFYKKVALKEITFELDENGVRISVDGEAKHYTSKTSPLAGMLGDIRLVDIDMHSATEETGEVPAQSDETALSLDEIDLFGIKEEEEELAIEESASDTNEEAIQTPTPQEEDELFELILPTDAENAIAEIDGSSETKDKSGTTETADLQTTDTQLPEDLDIPIYIDVVNISEKIGISTEDYNLFLNEYIDTALTFEQALQSNDETEKTEALQTLTHLSNVLHLPFVGDILNQIKTAPLAERESTIESFFATLGRLTTSHFEEDKHSSEEVPPPQQAETSEERRPSIDLSDVKPIHFDFQLEEAAKDLSLPVELIEEFVNDFITQAHEETEKLLAAYEKGDLETVQKIGHLLKGTSSNLRINALSDTLYEIQFNEDIDRVPELVRNYWAHFLSLENQIELISKK